MQAAGNIGGASRGAEADDDIRSGYGVVLQVLFSQGFRIFGPFFGPEDGVISAGDEPLDHIGVGTVRRRTFHGIEDAGPIAARAPDEFQALLPQSGLDDKLRYTLNRRWSLRAEAGLEQSADVEFKIER